MTASFASLSLSPSLLAVVADAGYARPTPVQCAAIPVLLAGKDLIAQSKTGSGKTAAFVLPVLQRIDLEDRSVQALVICPTRELAAQVARDFRALGRRHAGLTVVELVGGHRSKTQRQDLGRGAHVAVGTPGRLLDLLRLDALRTGRIATLVLDEADRMLDMGFGPDVEELVRSLPAARQTALFSATIPERVAALSTAYQRDAVRVTVDERMVEDHADGDSADAPTEIRQFRLEAAPEHRLHALCHVLHEFPHESALIFCNFKATVATLAGALADAGVSVGHLDGDMEQFHRDQMLARFRNGSVRLLVATDVAGRGLDVQGLDLVVNYELPQHAETYVHRIGRTGRAGRKGVAVSLTTPGQHARLQAIEALTGVAIEVIPRSPGDGPGLPALLRALAQHAKMRTVLISGGRKDKVRAGDILGALTGDAGGLESGQVGKIEIQDRLSYVAIAQSVASRAVERLNSGRIKGRRFRATLVDGGPGADRGRNADDGRGARGGTPPRTR